MAEHLADGSDPAQPGPSGEIRDVLATSRAFWGQVSIEALPPNNIPARRLEPLLQSLTATHHLTGVWEKGDPSLLLFHFPAPLDGSAVASKQVTLLFWSYSERFGPSLDVTVFLHGSRKNYAGKVTLIADASTLSAFVRSRFLCVLTVNGRPFRVLDIDARNVAPNDPHLLELDQLFARRAIYPDAEAVYWEALHGAGDNWRRFFSSSDHLHISWMSAYRYSVRRLTETVTRIQASDDASRVLETLPECVSGPLAALRRTNFDLRSSIALLEGFDRAGWSRFLLSFAGLREAVSDWPALESLPQDVLATYFYSPARTLCGLALPSLGLSDGQLHRLQLESERFEQTDAGRYWQDVGPLMLFVPTWRLLDGTDIPASLDTVMKSLATLPRAEDVDEAAAVAASLLAEAVATKQWSIPPRAIVDLPMGPFRYLELSETDADVFCVLRTQRHQFLITSVDPVGGTATSLAPPELVPDLDKIQAGVQLLLAALIRDFWVVEDRSTIFEGRPHVRGVTPRHIRDDSTPQVVYLPRIRYRYEIRPTTEECVRHLNLRPRRAHFVAPHLRRASSASANQEALAARYGFQLTQGYTFVRPHQRGATDRDVIYRSRSALQSLYTVEMKPQDGGTRPRWFTFETDVRNLMRALGFTVQHVSTAHGGDHGVDVLATKGHDLDEVNWIIQCKCFRPDRRIGPSVIREIIGALHNKPAGTRGMVVTTSAFTTGAIELAHQANIRLIDGEELSSRIQGAER